MSSIGSVSWAEMPMPVDCAWASFAARSATSAIWTATSASTEASLASSSSDWSLYHWSTRFCETLRACMAFLLAAARVW